MVLLDGLIQDEVGGDPLDLAFLEAETGVDEVVLKLELVNKFDDVEQVDLDEELEGDDDEGEPGVNVDLT